MSEDHAFAAIVAGEVISAHPREHGGIIDLLRMEKSLRTLGQSRVHIDGVLILVPQRQGGHPIDHRRRQKIPRGHQRHFCIVRSLAGTWRRAAAEGPERGKTAVVGRNHKLIPPLAPHAQPGILVIAAQADHPGRRRGLQQDKVVDHTARIGTAIHVVSEKHQGVLSVERRKFRQDHLQLSELSMDVAQSKRSARHDDLAPSRERG